MFDSICSNPYFLILLVIVLYLAWLYFRGGKYNLPQVDLSDKTTIVTGGARGLGKQTVK